MKKIDLFFGGMSGVTVLMCIMIMILLVVTILYGSVMNVVKLVECDFKAPYKAECLRIIGIPTGLGVVFGYMEIKDE